MFNRTWIVLGLLFTMSSGFSAPLNQHNTPQLITQHRIAAPFNQIWINAAINVVLHTHAKKTGIELRGDARDLGHLKTLVKNNRLIITYFGQRPKYPSVTAHIYTQKLNLFHYQGAGVISGKINSSALSLWIDNPGTTKLQGNITLRDLTVSGKSLVEIKGIKTNQIVLNIKDNPRVYLDGFIRVGDINMHHGGFLSMYWVKSEYLNVSLSDHAQLQLAGFVNVLEVKACDRAHFLGRYLRARRAFVKTYDHALAEINVIHREHTLASGASDIHIYHLPEMREDFMAYNGAVLDMRQWNLPEYEQETVYNKL